MFKFSTFKCYTQQLEQLAITSSRLSKSKLLREALTNTTLEQQKIYIKFMLAQIDNPLSNKQLIIPEPILYQAIAQAFQLQYRQVQDLNGEVDQIITLPQKESKSLEYIFNKLEKLFDIQGEGSWDSKGEQIIEILKECSTPIEVKYLVRFLQKKMRIGVSAGTIQGEISEELNQELLGYQKNVEGKLGVPIRPTLAKSYVSVEELVQDFIDKKKSQNKEYFCEYKYDGERLQVHYNENDGSVRLFGRSLEEKTGSFPLLIQQLKDYFRSNGIKNIILDCEMICYKDNRIIPFQDMQQKLYEESDQISLVCFDLLMYDQQVYINQEYSKRINLYQQLFKPITKQRCVITHINSVKYQNSDQLKQMFKQALDEGLEGLMIKKDSIYPPGLRTEWSKLKTEKDADLALLGAYKGKGKRKNVYGSFLLGIYNPEDELLYPITKLGTGFSDAMLKEFSKKEVLEEKPYGISLCNQKPDVWFPLGTIWEIKFDGVSQSPSYFIKNQDFSGGLSFRFPRFVRERRDKRIEDCMTNDQKFIMKQKQPNKKNEAPVPEEQQVQHITKEELPISDKFSVKVDPKSNLTIDEKLSFAIGEPGTKIYCVKWDQNDKYIACACDNGTIRVFNVANKKQSYLIPSIKPAVPFTYVKWRPQAPQFKTRNIFVTTNTMGEVQHWHLTSGKCLGTMTDDNKEAQLYSLDYNPDASKLAVCGEDPIIKIYDEEKRTLDLRLGVEQTQPPGHSNRVYCVKYHRQNPNILFSGGWDYRVIIWDIRQRKPDANQIYGPLICGDGIDLQDNFGEYNMVTASWTQEKQLQTWELRSCKLINTLDFDSQLKTSNIPAQLYCAQYSKQYDGTLILAGGSGSNEVKLFDNHDLDKCLFCIYDLCREVNTLDWANTLSKFAISGSDGYLRIFELQQMP